MANITEVSTRFGRLFRVDGTDQAFSTKKAAEEFAELRAARPVNVYEYFHATLIDPKECETFDAGTQGLTEYKMDSHCGRECKKIIDKSAELLAICDSHSHVVKHIATGTLIAVEIICFG